MTEKLMTGTLSKYKQTKQMQISCAITVQLISAFVFATPIVQFLFYLNPKFQASRCFLRLQAGLCLTCQTPRLMVFSHHGPFIYTESDIIIIEQRHKENIFVKCTLPYTPLLYSKTGVTCTGVYLFFLLIIF